MFSVVPSGWNPDEVLAFIEDLEDRLRVLLTARARGVDEAPEEFVARAEEAADEIRTRAVTEADRVRMRAADEARSIRIQGKRDAADIVASGRVLAAEIVAGAREQEETVYARISELRTVVRTTEELLESVADGGTPLTSSATTPGDFGLRMDERKAGAAALGLTAGPARGRRTDVPPQVRRLLDELQAPGSTDRS